MSKLTLGPAKVDLAGIRAGDRNEFTMTLHRGADPLDLTGVTLNAQARKKAADPDPPAITAVIEVTDATAGELAIRWPGVAVGVALAGAETWAGVWDLQASTGDGEEPLTLVAGAFGAVMDVTRP